ARAEIVPDVHAHAGVPGLLERPDPGALGGDGGPAAERLEVVEDDALGACGGAAHVEREEESGRPARASRGGHPARYPFAPPAMMPAMQCRGRPTQRRTR